MGVGLKKGDVIDMEYSIIEIKQELANEWFLCTVKKFESGICYDAVIFVDASEISMEIVVGVGYKDYERCKYNLLTHYIDCGLGSGFAYFIFKEKEYNSLYEYLSFMAKKMKDSDLYDFFMKEKASHEKNDTNKNVERSEFRKKIEHEIAEGDNDRKKEDEKKVNECIDNIVERVCNSIKTEIENKAVNKEFRDIDGKRYIKGYHEIEKSSSMYGIECYRSDEFRRLYRRHPDVYEEELNNSIYFRLSLYRVVERKEAEETRKIGRKEIVRPVKYYRYELTASGKRLFNGISNQLAEDDIKITYNFSRKYNDNEYYFTSSDFMREISSTAQYYLNIYYKMEV